MTAPIGKGSRFLVLTGLYIGREGVVVSEIRTRGGWWKVDIGEGEIIEVSPNDIEAGHLKRLADAPTEVDPIVVEIDALARAVDMEAIGQAGGVADAIRDSLDSEDDDDLDADSDGADVAAWFAAKRLLLVGVAALALAGARDIDRRRKVAP